MTPLRHTILPDTPRHELEALLLDSQLHEGQKIFANGDEANNHLDLGYEEVHERLRPQITAALGQICLDAQVQPDFIAAVPSGANGWAEELASFLANDSEKSSVLMFSKVGRRTFTNPSPTTETIRHLKLKSTLPEGIVLDDATSDGGTSEAMADFLMKQGLAVNLVLSIFYRGKLELLKSRYQRGFVIARHIPTQLDWKAFRQHGTLQELKTEID